MDDKVEVKSQLVGGARRYFAIAGYQNVLYVGLTRREVENWLKANRIEQTEMRVEENG